MAKSKSSTATAARGEGNALVKYFNGTRAELRKVTWPTRKETWSQTIVVLIVSIIAAVILGVYDAVWSHITDLPYNV